MTDPRISEEARPDTHVLRIDGPDQKGLVYKITGIIYQNELNIISNQEFVDPQTKRFFMRSTMTSSWRSPMPRTSVSLVLVS